MHADCFTSMHTFVCTYGLGQIKWRESGKHKHVQMFQLQKELISNIAWKDLECTDSDIVLTDINPFH